MRKHDNVVMKILQDPAGLERLIVKAPEVDAAFEVYGNASQVAAYDSGSLQSVERFVDSDLFVANGKR
jgi:hypothetical protein